ncbi:MAG: hypothetical protein KDG89_14140 [Geminicoccaceae bacterium]|nr:hypothetical protein [Geminicoccaceae bacterium]
MRRLPFVLALLLAPFAAAADCTNVAFDPAQLRRLDGSDVYAPFDGITYVARYGLTLRRGPADGGADCALYVVGAGEGPDRRLHGPGGGEIAYVLDRFKDQPLAFPVGTRGFDAGNAVPVVVPAAANSTAEAAFLVRIPANQVSAPAGGYADNTLDLEARTADAAFAPVDRTPVTLTLTVAPAVQILLAGNRTEGVVDFGELERGETGFAALYVTANTGYDLRFDADSLAAGAPALRRVEGGAYDGAWSLPYDATLDGAPVAFDAPVATDPAKPGDARRALRFRITGNPDRVRAGRYKDVVTIEIRARP